MMKQIFLIFFMLSSISYAKNKNVSSKSMKTEILVCKNVPSAADMACPAPCCDIIGSSWMVESQLNSKHPQWIYAKGDLPKCKFDECDKPVTNPKIEAKGTYVFNKEDQSDDFIVKSFKVLPVP